jgi:hypothetical protein
VEIFVNNGELSNNIIVRMRNVECVVRKGKIRKE